MGLSAHDVTVSDGSVKSFCPGSDQQEWRRT